MKYLETHYTPYFSLNYVITFVFLNKNQITETIIIHPKTKEQLNLFEQLSNEPEQLKYDWVGYGQDVCIKTTVSSMKYYQPQ
jgi:uncharacterized protein YegJ (DUF2314 family)